MGCTAARRSFTRNTRRNILTGRRMNKKQKYKLNMRWKNACSENTLIFLFCCAADQQYKIQTHPFGVQTVDFALQLCSQNCKNLPDVFGTGVFYNCNVIMSEVSAAWFLYNLNFLVGKAVFRPAWKINVGVWNLLDFIILFAYHLLAAYSRNFAMRRSTDASLVAQLVQKRTLLWVSSILR